ncbi:putative histone-arginine methyltransferase 1.3 [Forsythia ovata]|uniref:Histone-arginine methyltransferase 1.3 n=1 Tax=Forsythia ovata TaxID=205694 RepID=A0ABD1UZQ9_9LAMI
MEVSVGQNKQREQDFLVASISQLAISNNSSPPGVARFRSDAGVSELQFSPDSGPNDSIHFDLRTAQSPSSTYSLHLPEGVTTSSGKRKVKNGVAPLTKLG